MNFGIYHISDEQYYEILLEIQQCLENKLRKNDFTHKQEKNLAIKYLHDIGQSLPLFRRIITLNKMLSNI